MGCDIHPHVEVKIKGVWHHYSNPPIQRWYKLFERICGVRGDLKNAIAPPRGLPENLSVVTKVCYDIEDHHTPTWLTAQELDDLIRWADREDKNALFQHKEFGYLCGNMFVERDPAFEDVRFICWFDN